jgi:hypothetical protein
MTRSDRRRHLAIWLLLTPVILGVLIAALAVRADAEARRAGPAAERGREPRP